MKAKYALPMVLAGSVMLSGCWLDDDDNDDNGSTDAVTQSILEIAVENENTTILEAAETVNTDTAFDILSTKAKTVYSNNIRSNFGYMSRANDVDPFGPDKLFHQAGRRVFKEVCPMAAEHIASHLGQHELSPDNVNRWWLHQANINMNTLICKKLLGRDANSEEAPIVLDEYANTASAGSIIAFALYHQDLASQDVGVICSFGAGYSIGSLVVRKR